jgi:hypothetical protein
MSITRAPLETSGMVELRSLLASLTSVEKAYYLKFASNPARGKPSLHVRLFSLLIGPRQSAEAEVQRKLGVENGTQFSALKAHLQTDILDTLVYMRRHATPQHSLQTLMQHIEELTSRGLLKSAERVAKKALALAELHEAHDVAVRLTDPSITESSKTSTASHTAAVSRRERSTDAQRLFKHVEALRADAAISLTEAQTREVSALQSAFSRIACETAGEKLTRLRIETGLASCAYMLADFEEAKARARDVLKQVDAEPLFHAVLSEVSIAAESISLYAAFALKDLRGAAREISRGQQRAERFSDRRSRAIFDTILFNAELKVLHKRADYAGLKRLLDTRGTTMLSTARTTLSSDQSLVLRCSVFISHFVLGNFDEADALLYEVKEANHHARREDVLYLSTLFHLLILFEKRDWYRLHSATDAAYHLLYARKKLRPFEKDVMLFLRRLTTSRAGERIGHIAAFLQKLEAYKSDSVKQLYFLYFDYYGWLRSKVLGIEYQEYRRRELKGTLP